MCSLNHRSVVIRVGGAVENDYVEFYVHCENDDFLLTKQSVSSSCKLTKLPYGFYT